MDEILTDAVAPVTGATHVVYFDGLSNRRQTATLELQDQLEIHGHASVASWPYADIRRADSPVGVLRLSCLSAPPLARLEIRDAVLAAQIESRCDRLDLQRVNRSTVARIVGWSLAAAASIIAVVLFVIPLAADRLTPLVPPVMERHLGEAADLQVKAVFGDKVCNQDTAGQRAFTKLVDTLRVAAGLDATVASSVLNTSIPNAFALPGGRVYLFDGLLAKSENVDEIAGVLGHELGHLRHRDGVREMIHNGGSSFLIGLLFGDITGASAVIFASRTLVTASYSREAEHDADSFAIDLMHKLGRPTRPMGELMFRVTGKQGDKLPSFLGSHPLTEDRLQRMAAEDRPASGPELLSADEWAALKRICK